MQDPVQGFPTITHVLPSAMVIADSPAPTILELQGFNIACSNLSVLCRSGGRYLPVSLAEGQAACCSTSSQHRDSSMQTLRVQLSAKLPAGAVIFARSALALQALHWRIRCLGQSSNAFWSQSSSHRLMKCSGILLNTLGMAST